MLGAIFERFVKESPISVMVRGLIERVFAPLTIDRIFEENASSQYTRELLFSSLVELTYCLLSTCCQNQNFLGFDGHC